MGSDTEALERLRQEIARAERGGEGRVALALADARLLLARLEQGAPAEVEPRRVEADLDRLPEEERRWIEQRKVKLE
jgi:hypothetical protein